MFVVYEVEKVGRLGHYKIRIQAVAWEDECDMFYVVNEWEAETLGM